MSDRAPKSKIHQIDGLQEKITDIFNATKYEKVTVAPSGVITLTENSLGIYKFELTLATVSNPSIDVGSGAKNIKDLDGVTLTSLKKGHYEVIADATFFTLRSRGNKGFDPVLTAVAGEVLAGETFSINGKDILVGTMPNRGALNLTPTDAIQNGAAGYYSGITVAARPVLSGTASTGQVLAGSTFYNSSYTKQTGVIPVTSPSEGDTIAPSSVTMSGGYAHMMLPVNTYLSGVNWVKHYQPGIAAGNFLNTVSIFGVQGNIPHRANYDDVGGVHPIANASEAGPGIMYLRPPRGYYDGGVWTQMSIPSLIASNIRSGVLIGGGLTGTMEPSKYATGEGSLSPVLYSGKYYNRFAVSGLSFRPRVVILDLQAFYPASCYDSYSFPRMQSYAGSAHNSFYGTYAYITWGSGQDQNIITADGFSMVGGIADYTDGRNLTWHAFG